MAGQTEVFPAAAPMLVKGSKAPPAKTTPQAFEGHLGAAQRGPLTLSAPPLWGQPLASPLCPPAGAERAHPFSSTSSIPPRPGRERWKGPPLVFRPVDLQG